MEDVKPIYDDKVREILRGLASGKSREELADAAGNSNWKSIDMYMRRRNFTWDSRKLTYVPKQKPLKEDVFMDSSKAGHAISLLSKEGADVRAVAERLGFHSHRELADYMKRKGYSWNNDKNNYDKQVGKIASEKKEEAEEMEEEKPSVSSIKPTIEMSEEEGWERFSPLLEMLDRHKERLLDLIVPTSQTGIIPRFLVPGVGKTKTIQIMNTLEQMVIDFSREKNISQRELFEVALIEFFRKYGYEQEVERLLNR